MVWWMCTVVCVVGMVSGGSGQSLDVDTQYGAVRGVRVSLGPHSYVDKFLNIPYAQPPVGNLRFRAPEPALRWNGTRDGSHFGPMCPQPPDSYLLPSQVFPQDEDCLVLNVYRPKVSDAGARLPVMVWIHGGGFLLGSGNRFDWTQLAATGVVIVTLNYRLDSFGFLSTEDSVSPGNYGLLDQILALKWVRDVISVFNGDPTNVTIFGESAGGSSVSLLVLSRKAKGLFHKAIMESGSSLNTFSMNYPGTRPEPRKQAVELGKRLGCHFTDISHMMDCLRTKDVVQFLSVSGAMRAASGWVFRPIPEAAFGEEDGVFAGTPETILHSNGFSDVPTIRGFNHDEGAFGFQDTNNDGLTMEEFLHLANSAVRPYLQHPFMTLDVDAIMTRVIDAYVITPNITDPNMLLHAFIQLKTDFLLAMPILLEAHMATQHRIHPQYVYSFVYRSAHRLTPPWKGVQHMDEIPYVSGAPVCNISALPGFVSTWTDDDISVSHDVMMMWSNFAKYGDPTPTSTNGTRWLPWTHNGQKWLEIGSARRMVNDPLTPQQKLWFTILPQIHSGIIGSPIG